MRTALQSGRSPSSIEGRVPVGTYVQIVIDDRVVAGTSGLQDVRRCPP